MTQRAVDNGEPAVYGVDGARDEAIRRLFTAGQHREPSELERKQLNALSDTAIEFGTVILAACPPGRETALAMTHLEDALMRARRAIFTNLV